MGQGSEIDLVRRLAARALDLKPRIAAIYRLVDGRRGIDRFSVRPHPLVPAFSQEPIGLAYQCVPLARSSSDCAAKMPVIARALPSSFFKALRSPPDRGAGWCSGAIRNDAGLRSDGLEGRPAAVFLMAATPVLASVV
jgi:hypothetical protein